MADLGVLTTFRRAGTFRRLLYTAEAVALKMKALTLRHYPVRLSFKHTNTQRRLIETWSTRSPVVGTNTTNYVTQLFLPCNPGSLSGTVKTLGIPDAEYLVRLYYRPTGYFIDQVRTASDGSFTFDRAIDKNDIGNYFAIAFDSSGDYNAIIFDRMTPV